MVLPFSACRSSGSIIVHSSWVIDGVVLLFIAMIIVMVHVHVLCLLCLSPLAFLLYVISAKGTFWRESPARESIAPFPPNLDTFLAGKPCSETSRQSFAVQYLNQSITNLHLHLVLDHIHYPSLTTTLQPPFAGASTPTHIIIII